MLAQVFAFLAVATVAFATTCGPCYSGYGLYQNALPGAVAPGCLQSRVVGCCETPFVNGVFNLGFAGLRGCGYGCGYGCVDPCQSCRTFAGPAFASVGSPEVTSSCENSVVAGCGCVRGIAF